MKLYGADRFAFHPNVTVVINEQDQMVYQKRTQRSVADSVAAARVPGGSALRTEADPAD